MRARVAAAVVLTLALFAAAFTAEHRSMAAAKEPALNSLAAWEGKYPFGEPGKYGPFFEDPAVKRALKNAVPDALMKKILNWTVNIPFQRDGDILFSTLCKPHDCGDNNATIYFDMVRLNMQVCLTEYDKKINGLSNTWFGNTIRQLEPGSCNGDMSAIKRFGDSR